MACPVDSTPATPLWSSTAKRPGRNRTSQNRCRDAPAQPRSVEHPFPVSRSLHHRRQTRSTRHLVPDSAPGTHDRAQSTAPLRHRSAATRSHHRPRHRRLPARWDASRGTPRSFPGQPTGQGPRGKETLCAAIRRDHHDCGSAAPPLYERHHAAIWRQCRLSQIPSSGEQFDRHMHMCESTPLAHPQPA